MIASQDVYLTFPWFSRKQRCMDCDAVIEHDLWVAVRFFGFVFVPLFPKEVMLVRQCRACRAEMCITSTYPIHAAWRWAVVGVVGGLLALGMWYLFRHTEWSTKAEFIGWCALAGVGGIAFLIASAKAHHASRTSEERRKPGKRSFMRDIENGFWVVMPFGAFVSFLLAFGGFPWVWRGDVPFGWRVVAFKVCLLIYIFIYWLRKRLTLSVLRAGAYGLVFAAVFTDVLMKLLALNNFLAGLVFFVATLGLVLAGHYWSLSLSRTGGRDAIKLKTLLDAMHSGDRGSGVGTLELLGQMLDSPAVSRNIEEVVACLRQQDGGADPKHAHVADFFESMHNMKYQEPDDAALRQRVCMGSACIVFVRESYVCCRDEGMLGSRTRFITLTEIDPEPVTRLVWGLGWLKASLAPLALLVISTLAMLLAGDMQPVSFVVFGGLALFCIVQGLLSTGRKMLFYDRYHSQVLFGLFLSRPSRGQVTDFVDKLSRSIQRGDAAPVAEPPAKEPQPPESEPTEAPAKKIG